MEKISRKGFLKIAAAAAMSSVTAAGLAAMQPAAPPLLHLPVQPASTPPAPTLPPPRA